MKKFTVKQLLLELIQDKKLSEIIKTYDLDKEMVLTIMLGLIHKHEKDIFWT
jgi:hypothetical protein